MLYRRLEPVDTKYRLKPAVPRRRIFSRPLRTPLTALLTAMMHYSSVRRSNYEFRGSHASVTFAVSRVSSHDAKPWREVPCLAHQFFYYTTTCPNPHVSEAPRRDDWYCESGMGNGACDSWYSASRGIFTTERWQGRRGSLARGVLNGGCGMIPHVLKGRKGHKGRKGRFEIRDLGFDKRAGNETVWCWAGFGASLTHKGHTARRSMIKSAPSTK